MFDDLLALGVVRRLEESLNDLMSHPTRAILVAGVIILIGFWLIHNPKRPS